MTIRNKANFLLLTAIGLFAGAPSVSATLIAHWELDGNATDETGNHNGTVNGATLTADRFGNPNSAYDFTRPNSITTSGWSGGLPATTTFSMWAQADSFPNTMLFNAGNNGQGPDLFFVPGGNPSYISWNVWDAGNNSFTTFPTTVIADQQWHHYVVVNDQGSNTAQLYIDGGLEGTAAYRAGNNAFTIGNSHANGGWGWDGDIDDVQIYDTALTLADVSSLHSSGSVSVPESGSTLALFGGVILAFGVFRSKVKGRR
jgi:hypothetical protein